jgi:hypothetical protein
MGRSVGESARQPNGFIHHQLSESKIAIRSHDGVMRHELTHRGLTAEYDIAYTIGAGKVGYSYLVRNGNYIFQSPASFYTAGHQWDLTPGYESEHTLDFDHPILSGCLFCHTDSVKLIAGTANQFEPGPLESISCDRCHGSAEAHLRNPAPGSIVNPAKLPSKARDAVCEQCHLEGAARILNSGRTWWDYRPGVEIENTFVTYVHSREQNDIPAVSQSEQLAESACLRGSAGKLWCGSCHNPHGGDRDIRAVCVSCHSGLFAANGHRSATASSDCVNCHMPRLRATNVAHAAVTDHRIPRNAIRMKNASPAAESATRLRAWREPADDLSKQRGLGLAYFENGATHHMNADLIRSYEILKPITHASSGDADLQAAVLGILLLDPRQAAAALPYLEDAVKASPQDAHLRLLLGSELAQHGDRERAIEELEAAIRLDPSKPEAYKRLAEVYGHSEMYQKTLERYLNFMPRSIRIRESLRLPR